MTDFPDVKLKALVNFPATVRDGTGIDVTKEDGHYQLDLAYDDFAPSTPSILDPTNQTILIWNEATEAYTLVPVSEFGVGGAITEAPTDGQQYGRQSSTWTVITVGDGDYGDITVSGSGATWTIDADTVTFSKMQNASDASVLVGRGQGAGGGDFQQITLGSNVTMTGTVLNVSSGTATVGDGDYGDIVVSGGGTVMTIDSGVVTNANLASDIGLAPVDAMAANGMQINGGMEVSQELGVGVGTSTPSEYACDGYILSYGGGVVMSSAAIVYSIASGFPNILNTTVSTALPSLGATGHGGITKFVEGYRSAHLGWGASGAQPITIGFWSRNSRAGLYSIRVSNNAGDRCYVATYTQIAAHTAQYNTIVIPGDVTGTWNTTNSIGLNFFFAMAAGTTYTAPAADAWLPGHYLAAPGQVNGIAATTDYMQITGFVILPGTHNITAAQSPLFMRPYDEELATCQRYFKWLPFNLYFYATVVGEALVVPLSFSTMRASPTIGAIAPDPNTTPVDANHSASLFSAVTPYSAELVITATATGASYVRGYRCSADARL